MLNASNYGNIPQTRERIYLVCFKDKELYKAINGNILDFYIEGNILVIDENRETIALYEGDKENNRLICTRVLKERE